MSNQYTHNRSGIPTMIYLRLSARLIMPSSSFLLISTHERFNSDPQAEMVSHIACGLTAFVKTLIYHCTISDHIIIRSHLRPLSSIPYPTFGKCRNFEVWSSPLDVPSWSKKPHIRRISGSDVGCCRWKKHSIHTGHSFLLAHSSVTEKKKVKEPRSWNIPIWCELVRGLFLSTFKTGVVTVGFFTCKGVVGRILR